MEKNKINSLTDFSETLPKVTVAELIARLQTLPQDQEIVIYNKYDETPKYYMNRFRVDNVREMQQNSDGYEYCAIIF